MSDDREEAGMSDRQLFGLTAEQRYFIEQTAEAAAEKAVDKLVAKECPHDCKDVKGVKATLYGDDGKSGLCGEHATVKEQVANLVWQTRLIAGATVGSIVALIAQLVVSR